MKRISKQFSVVCFMLLATISGAILKQNEVKKLEKNKLIEDTSKILCSFHTKTIYVYFENKTSKGYAPEILQELSKCGTSYISMRNRFRTSPLAAIKDDGVLMYLLIILHDARQTIEFSIIEKKSAAKYLSHVLIIIEDSSAITFNWLRGIFKKFWQIWFPNVVIIYWHNNTLQVYRYNPFAKNFLIKINYDAYVPLKNELFPKQLPNLEKKPLRICLYEDELRAIFYKDGRLRGSDGLMTEFIAERLNATLFINRKNTYGYENRTADLCFREIVTGLDDIALNIRFLVLTTFYKKVESTIVYSRDDLCVLVPKAEIASMFWNLFRTYSILVWLIIILMPLLAYFFCETLYKSLCHRCCILLQLFGSSIGVSFYNPPLKFSLRLFLGFWFFYGLLVCGAFKGTLTSNLVFRTYEPDINTLQELALSPYKLLLYPRHLKHLERFLNVSNKYEAILKQKLTIVPDGVLVKELRLNNRSLAYLQKFHVAKFKANARIHTRAGRPLYHMMNSCIVPFHAVFIVPYGSPYLGALNFLVRSSYEFGFIHYWERLMNAYFLKSGKSISRRESTDEDPVILKLPHFQAAFCLWAFGLLVACLVFLYERFCDKLKGFLLRKKRTRPIKRQQTLRKIQKRK